MPAPTKPNDDAVPALFDSIRLPHAKAAVLLCCSPRLVGLPDRFVGRLHGRCKYRSHREYALVFVGLGRDFDRAFRDVAEARGALGDLGGLAAFHTRLVEEVVRHAIRLLRGVLNFVHRSALNVFDHAGDVALQRDKIVANRRESQIRIC